MSGEKLDFWRVWHAFSLAVNTSDNLFPAYIRIDNRVVYSNNSKYKVAFSSDKFPVNWIERIPPYIFIISSMESDKRARPISFHSYVHVFLSVFQVFLKLKKKTLTV